MATLATLILLSYAKLINTIASLSFSVLDNPDSAHQFVWLPDGTVGYIS